MALCLTFEPLYATLGGDKFPDWSGGARSVVSYGTNCWYGWEVPRASRGVVVGLNDEDVGTTWLEIDYGYRFKDGGYKFLEHGQLLDPDGPWSVYAEGDRFYVFRLDNRVVYCKRSVSEGVPTTYVHPDFPGYVFPGPVLAVSVRPSFGTVFLDSALWAENDTVDAERSGVTWRSLSAELEGPENLGFDFARSGTMFISLPLTAAGATIGVNAGAMTLELPLDVDATGVTDVGMALELPISVLGSDSQMDTYMIGELPLAVRGGEFMQGDGNSGIAGALLLDVTARGYEGSVAMIGELPAPVIAATGSYSTQPVETGVWGELPAPILAATGSEDGQTAYKAYMVGELPAPILAASGTNDVETPYDAYMVGELPAPIIQAMGTSTIGAITSFIEGELPAPVIEMIGSSEEPNALFIVLAFTGDIVSEPLVSEFDVLDEFYALTAPVQVSYANEQLDAILIGSVVQTFYNPTVSLLDQALALAATRGDFVLAVSDTMSISDDITATQVIAVAEALYATGSVATLYQGMVAVVSAMTIVGTQSPAYAVKSSDALTVGTSVDVAMAAELLEAMTVATSIENTLTIIVEETAAMLAADTVELSAHLLANIVEYADIYALVKTTADIAQGWVMNTEGANPISEYDNYTFNSMTFFKGVTYGTSDDGVYTLDGDDDAGTNITGELASMLLDFGTSRMKRIRSAYLGYTSTNELVMKVRSVSQGQLSEHWYKATQNVTADAPEGSYMPVGQGLKSRYWQFELTNIDGGDFEIDQIELHPLILNRRV